MFSKPPKCRRLLVAALWVARVVEASPPGDVQDVERLEQLARSAAQQALPPLNARERLQVGPLPPHLQLARCPGDVKAARAPGLQVAGRVLIELRCDSGSPWHIYVPVKTIGTTPVVVAVHALVAGTVLEAKDLRREERDLVGLPPGYLDDPDIAVGMTAARALAGGTLLTNQQLLGVQAVLRGQTVTLIATSGGISVRMAGRALSDGFVNQRVKVENLSSGKIVEGIARSPQVVEIVF